MKQQEKQTITAFIGRTLNLPAEEVAALFKADGDEETFSDTALDSLFKHDATRVQNFTAKNQEFFDNGVKKERKEALSRFEKEIREKFNVTEDKQGLDLIESVVMAKIKAQGGDLDEEKIKRSDVYLKAVERLIKEKDEAVTEATTKYKTLEQTIASDKINSSIRSSAKEIIMSLNPILPEGKTGDGKLKSDIQVERLVDELISQHQFEIKGDKTLIIKDGKVMEDPHGNIIDFKKYVSEKASYVWDFKEGEARKGTGNNNDNDGNSGAKKGYQGPAIESSEQYMKLMAEAKDEETKMEITKAYNESPATRM
jgi:hypothetical protein